MENIIKFNSTNELEKYIVDNFFNKDENISKMKFKLPHSSEYKILSNNIIESTNTKIKWQATFITEQSGDYEYRTPTVRILYTDRYIKTQDRLILKCIEKIELC